MKAAVGLSLMLIGLALEWVAIHGYTAPSGSKGFSGLVESLYSSIDKAAPDTSSSGSSSSGGSSS